MPIHDWTRVPSGLFHHFHQSWTIAITGFLNRNGNLPKGYSALVERSFEAMPSPSRRVFDGVSMAKPVTSYVFEAPQDHYELRANRIVIKHCLTHTIAVIQIVSPGNKDTKRAFREFVDKTVDFLRSGIHVLVIDLFPPTARDPFGIHKAIWDEIHAEDFALPEGRDRTLVSYEVDGVRVAYVEPFGLGEALPEMPLFLWNDFHVIVPLEPTYQVTWDAAPEEFRIAVETGVIPDPDAE